MVKDKGLARRLRDAEDRRAAETAAASAAPAPDASPSQGRKRAASADLHGEELEARGQNREESGARGSRDPAPEADVGMGASAARVDIERVLCELGFDGTQCAESIVGASVEEMSLVYRLSPAYLLDLAAPGPDGKMWDFSDEADRKKCEMAIEAQQPMLVVGGSQPGSTWEAQTGKGKSRVVQHLRFLMGIYAAQCDRGRFFLQAHRRTDPFYMEVGKDCLSKAGVRCVQMGQATCSTTWRPGRSGWVGNCEPIMEQVRVGARVVARGSDSAHPRRSRGRHSARLEGAGGPKWVAQRRDDPRVVRGGAHRVVCRGLHDIRSDGAS